MVHISLFCTSLLTDWTGQWCTSPSYARPYSLTGLVSGAYYVVLHVPTHWTGQWCTSPSSARSCSVTRVVTWKLSVVVLEGMSSVVYRNAVIRVVSSEIWHVPCWPSRHPEYYDLQSLQIEQNILCCYFIALCMMAAGFVSSSL